MGMCCKKKTMIGVCSEGCQLSGQEVQRKLVERSSKKDCQARKLNREDAMEEVADKE